MAAKKKTSAVSKNWEKAGFNKLGWQQQQRVLSRRKRTGESMAAAVKAVKEGARKKK